MSRKSVAKPDHSTLLWRRVIIQHSVSRRWIGRSVYTLTSSHFCLCRIIQILSRLTGSPVAFFLFRIPDKAKWMKFNSWWAAYNSSSLGAITTGGSDFPMRNKAGHLEQSIKMDKSFSLSFLLIMYNISLSGLLIPPYVFLQKSKPWGDMKTNIKKNFNSEMKRTERYTIHPRAFP